MLRPEGVASSYRKTCACSLLVATNQVLDGPEGRITGGVMGDFVANHMNSGAKYQSCTMAITRGTVKTFASSCKNMCVFPLVFGCFWHECSCTLT